VGQVADFVVRLSVVPAAPRDANPLEGKGAQDGLVSNAVGTPALAEGLSPEGMAAVWFRRARSRDGCAKCPGYAYTQPVLSAFRGWIYRLLAFCVFMLTLGRVQVNTTGRATVDGPGRDDTNISAKEGSR
jgi:hypothetical protein